VTNSPLTAALSSALVSVVLSSLPPQAASAAVATKTSIIAKEFFVLLIFKFPSSRLSWA
jgi:hypothetical protein